jgi:DNA-binding XRE family transcriptional regulator
LVAIVSQNIKKYRALTGMKQDDLAKAVHVSQAAISNLESGKRGCSLEVLEKIAIALNIQAAALLMNPE